MVLRSIKNPACYKTFFKENLDTFMKYCRTNEHKYKDAP